MRNVFIGAFLIFLLMQVRIITPVHADSAPPANLGKFNFSAPSKELSGILLQDANEEGVPLSQFRGKIVLLNVWATWCGPCVMELPQLDKLQADVGSSDFVVMPVSIDRGGAHKAMPFLTRMDVHAVTPYFDPSNSIGRLLGASRIPMTLIIGRDGNEIGRMVGTNDWDSPETIALMRYFIENGGDSVRSKDARADQVAMTR